MDYGDDLTVAVFNPKIYLGYVIVLENEQKDIDIY